MRAAILLFIALGICWISLSGYFTGMLLTLGLISILLVLYLCKRMNILDSETAPYLYVPKTLSYFIWLGKEIFNANIAVVKLVLRPDLEISPTLVKIPVEQNTDLGRSMFANSITLTPGTVSVNLEDDHILVHSITTEMADPSGFEEMSHRSGASVGDSGAPSQKGNA